MLLCFVSYNICIVVCLNKMQNVNCIWKKKQQLTVGSEHSWKCWQRYLIPPHGLLFSCRLIEKTDSLFSAGQMSFSDRQGLFHKQRGAEVVSNSGKFVTLHKVNWQTKSATPT